jgi:hypothetical protein
VPANSAPIYRDVIQLFAKAAKAAHSLDADKLKAALQTFTNAWTTASNYSYTWTASNHSGFTGPVDACELALLSPVGLPYKAGS